MFARKDHVKPFNSAGHWAHLGFQEVVELCGEFGWSAMVAAGKVSALESYRECSTELSTSGVYKTERLPFCTDSLKTKLSTSICGVGKVPLS